MERRILKKICPGPRRIIVETDLSASSLVSASPENKKYVLVRDGSTWLQPGERHSLEQEITKVRDGSLLRRTFPHPAR